jgi:hypothetical protein
MVALSAKKRVSLAARSAPKSASRNHAVVIRIEDFFMMIMVDTQQQRGFFAWRDSALRIFRAVRQEMDAKTRRLSRDLVYLPRNA